MIRVPLKQLTAVTRAVFEACGVPSRDAAVASSVLCAADERGIHSHGVRRLGAYVDLLKSRSINPVPSPRIATNTPSTALIDGDNGLGLVVGDYALDVALSTARTAGSAWIGVKNSNHFGIAGYYALKAADQNAIAIIMSNTPPLVAPLGGAERMLGTNPIAVAIPRSNGTPILIDFSTSALSLGQVESARSNGTVLRSQAIVSKEGEPSDDPSELFRGGALMPLGGISGHKGYGLSCMIDILCGVLNGASWGPYVPPFLSGPASRDAESGEGIGHTIITLCIDSFVDASAFKAKVADWYNTMIASKPMHTDTRITVPGDPEATAQEHSRVYGVGLEDSVLDELLSLADVAGYDTTDIWRRDQ